MDRMLTALMQILLQVLASLSASRGRALIWQSKVGSVLSPFDLSRFQSDYTRCYAVSGCAAQTVAVFRPMAAAAPPWLFARREVRGRVGLLD